MEIPATMTGRTLRPALPLIFRNRGVHAMALRVRVSCRSLRQDSRKYLFFRLRKLSRALHWDVLSLHLRNPNQLKVAAAEAVEVALAEAVAGEAAVAVRSRIRIE